MNDTPIVSPQGDPLTDACYPTQFLRQNNRELSSRRPPVRDEQPGIESVADSAPAGIDSALMGRLNRLQQFSILAIRIDAPDDQPKTFDEQVRPAIEELLRKAEIKDQAFWFTWEPSLYMCVIADRPADSALEIARSFQVELALSRPETVTIGVATFPLISFNRSQSLINARKALEHAAFFGPNSAVIFDAVSLNISGDQHFQTGEMGAAIAEYRAALRLDPHNVNVINSLGICMAAIHDLAAARESFQKALAIDPNEAMAHFNLGRLHQIEEDLPAALSCFEHAFANKPESFEINLHLGAVLVRLERWPEARPYLETAITLRGDSGAAFCAMGRCLSGLGQLAEAIKAYEKAAKLNPNDAAALSALGTLYADKGENKDICLTFCRQSVLLSPRNGLFRFRLAALYQKYDLLDEALAEYEQAAALGYDSTRRIDEVRRLLRPEISA
jgi:tetratricopeptide (TPR) repeat protein